MSNEHAQALALAGGAIVNGLLNVLVAKGVLTNTEVRSILADAVRQIGHYGQAPGADQASAMITGIMSQRFPERPD